MSKLVVRTLKLLAENKGVFVSAGKNIFNTRTMATLKINTLSVGDWVRYGDKIYKLYAIEVCGLLRGVWEDSECITYITKNIDYFDPIPITPEILEANGFVKWQGGLLVIGKEVSCRYEGGNLAIKRRYRDNEGALVERLLVNIECLYVHQLQHALRLAGVDKEISLI